MLKYDVQANLPFLSNYPVSDTDEIPLLYVVSTLESNCTNYFATGGVQRIISEGMVNLLIYSKLGFKFKIKYEVVSTLLQTQRRALRVLLYSRSHH